MKGALSAMIHKLSAPHGCILFKGWLRFWDHSAKETAQKQEHLSDLPAKAPHKKPPHTGVRVAAVLIISLLLILLIWWYFETRLSFFDQQLK